MPAHPADLLGGYTGHKGIGFDVFVDHGASTDESVFTDGDAADDGAVGTKSGAFFDHGFAVFVFAGDRRTGVVNVGEYHAGSAKDIVFQSDGIVDADVVLHLAVVADDHVVADKDILPEGAGFADFCLGADMNPVPYAGAFADLGSVVNDGRRMDADIGHIFDSVESGTYFFRQGHSGGPFPTQYRNQFAGTVDGVFACRTGGVVGAMEQGAQAGEALTNFGI